MENPTISLRQQVENLVMEGFQRAEIVEAVPALSPNTIHSYVKEVLKGLTPEQRRGVQTKRDERPISPKAQGGQTPFKDKTYLSLLHRRVGIRIYNHRNKSGLSLTEYAKTHGFSNRVRLSHMEQGFYDFSLSELIEVAKAMQVEVATLLEPMTEGTIAK